jgi:hypothetical protein
VLYHDSGDVAAAEAELLPEEEYSVGVVKATKVKVKGSAGAAFLELIRRELQWRATNFMS